MAARPTMKDVARAAGVSLMTVSRVVAGETGVAPQTAARVEEAIRALGYQRNDIARNLQAQGAGFPDHRPGGRRPGEPVLLRPGPLGGGRGLPPRLPGPGRQHQRRPAPGARRGLGLQRPPGGRPGPGPHRRQPLLLPRPDGPRGEGGLRRPPGDRPGRGLRRRGQPRRHRHRGPPPAGPGPQPHRVPGRPPGDLDPARTFRRLRTSHGRRRPRRRPGPGPPRPARRPAKPPAPSAS